MRTLREHAVRSVSTLLVAAAIVATGTGIAGASGPAISLTPHAGVPGSTTHVTGLGFAAGETVKIVFINTSNGVPNIMRLGTATADSTGGFAADVKIPSVATVGAQKVRAVGETSKLVARKTFFVK